MAKYLFTNWETVPFKRKSFEGQLDRYIKVCVASVDKPQQVLMVLPLYGKNNGGGFTHLIEIVRNHELGQDENNKFLGLLEPVEGAFVDVPSKHGPLFRLFTKDDAKYGICPNEYVGKVERTPTGKVKVYHSVRVFIIYGKDNETGNVCSLHGWFPEEWYYRFFFFFYKALTDLTEPLQL